MSLGSTPQDPVKRPESGQTWDKALISDAWFQGHFEYAAQTVIEWLGKELEAEDAELLDFGCGDGITALSVALNARPKRLLGVDIRQAFSRLDQLAKDQLDLDALPDVLEFRQVKAGR